MKREDLESIRGIKAEIKAIEEELRHLPVVMDSVKGSMPEFPYIKHNIPIKGVDVRKEKSLEGRLRRKVGNLENLLVYIENEIDALPDIETGTIIRMKYINGNTEEEIARELNYTRSAVAMKLLRFFKK